MLASLLVPFSGNLTPVLTPTIRKFNKNKCLCGGREIRTLGSALQHYDGLANRCLKPLGHPSKLQKPVA